MTAKKVYESGENAARSQSFQIPTTGSIDAADFKDDFEQVNEFDYRKMADLEKFMNEPVLVEIPASNNKNDDPFIQLGVNGTNQAMLRGKPQWIKRKYLEVLLRANPTTLETVEEFDPRTGNKTVRLIKTTGEKYPYRIHEDHNPLGRPWMSQLLAEPT